MIKALILLMAVLACGLIAGFCIDTLLELDDVDKPRSS